MITQPILKDKKKPKYVNPDQKRDSLLSDFSIGSLGDLERELIDSLLRQEPEPTLSSSDVTEGSEFHSVYGNSELRIRGIDVENLKDRNGKDFDVFNLFKARFQQYSDGKHSIDNKDVVRLLGRLMKNKNNNEVRSFLVEGEKDYKAGYEPKDTNFRNF